MMHWKMLGQLPGKKLKISLSVLIWLAILLKTIMIFLKSDLVCTRLDNTRSELAIAKHDLPMAVRI